ncbi:hypothetical protein FSARC_14324 [Fusarium sarcochroum]|uniref:Uncharacterized protein n=1 Tax=Fusarium sarcochroum TaxID=1208366 RepID=A0A8H4SUG1_9HYPO|nr:hypothetical protein FSARC_14324 [Fusarium sarcochroum]
MNYQGLFALRSGVRVDILDDGHSLNVHYRATKPGFEIEDLLYISHILRPMFIKHDLLVELYFDNPQKLRRRARDMYDLEQKLLDFSSNDYTGEPLGPLRQRSEEFNRQLDVIQSRLQQDFVSADIMQLHRSDLMRNEFQEAVLPSGDIEFAYEFLFLVYRDFYQYYSQSPWEKDIWNLRYPTIYGMVETMFLAFQRYLDLLRQRISAIERPVLGQASLPQNHILANSGEKLPDVTVLFAVAGSGKTKSIVDFLQHRIGYYILAGNISPQSDNTLYEPRRSEPADGLNGSKDTWSLCQMLRYELPPWQSQALQSGNISEAVPCELIKLAREIILERFRQEVNNSLPAWWFRFQTDCSHVDPFDDIFHLLVLLPRADLLDPNEPLVRELTKNNQPYHASLPKDHHQPLVQYVCIDEAQVDLTVPLPNGSTVNLLKGMLGSWCMHLNVVLSGTSLNIQSAIETIQSQETSFAEVAFLNPKIASRLPMIVTDNDFDTLLKQRNGGLYQYIFYTNLMAPVLAASSRLRGRFRWSTMFIDGLATLKFPTTEDEIRQTSQNVYRLAKDGLTRQLEKMRERTDPQSYKLIHETLPNAAIWSHLLDQPYVFPSSEQLTLVEYGLATVEVQGKELKARLVETIAIDAIIEGLGGQTEDLIGQKLLQILNELQDDAGGFGTKAERLFVWELRNCLRDRSTNGLIGFDAQRRDGLVNLFAKAQNSFGLALGMAIPVFDYFLIEGDSISHKPETGVANTMQLSEWLYSIRQGSRPKYSFLLPDENVGPDIVLVLRRAGASGTYGADHILCFLQLKTGASVLSGQKLVEALNTTVRKGFYKAAANTKAKGPSVHAQRKQDVDSELSTPFWQAAKKLSVLITAAQSSKADIPTLLDDEYFVWIDRSTTAKISGPAFAKLLEEVKG